MEPTNKKSIGSNIFDMSTILVEQSLKGWVDVNSGLVRLEGHNVILRRDYRTLNQVRILSGGWSGFEPMSIGFVGPGMLTAAAVGDQFSSPPITSILAVIRELAEGNPHGILIILMNHPVQKLNFMLAVEKAYRENILVKLVFIADDCSGVVGKQRKGLAGISFIIKIAGAMADEKCTLEEICTTCYEAGSDLATLSVNIFKKSLNSPEKSESEAVKSEEDFCSLEGGSACFNSLDTTVQLVQIVEDLTGTIRNSSSYLHAFSSITELAKTLLGYTVDGTYSPYSILKDDQSPFVLLFNNYVNVISLEVNALVHEICNELRCRQMIVKRIYIGSFVGSRSMGGFSISIMKVNQYILDCLDHSVMVPGWPLNVSFMGDPTTPLPKYVRGQVYNEEEPKMLGPILDIIHVNKIYKALENVCMALISCEEQVNKMCMWGSHWLYGTHVKTAAQAITEALYTGELKVNCPYVLFSKLSTICSNSLRTDSGTLYAIFFDGVSQSFLKHLNQTKIEDTIWLDAFRSGIKAIEFFTELKRGDRTILDALYPMLEVMKKPSYSIVQIAEAAELGSLNTVRTDEKAHSVPDVTAHVVALWARAIAEGLNSATSYDDFQMKNSDQSSLDDDDILLIG